MANVRNEIATRAAIPFNFVRGVRGNRDPCPSHGFVSASRSSACRSSVMNDRTPTFPSDKLCLLGITLRKWRATVANPTVPLAHVSPVHSLARNFLIEGITRATAYESERGGRLVVLRTKETTLYMYDFWFLNFIYRGSRAKVCWLDKIFVSSRIDSWNRVFLQRAFLNVKFRHSERGTSSKSRRGYSRVSHRYYRGRTWIHLVDKFSKLSLMVYRSVDVSSTSG